MGGGEHRKNKKKCEATEANGSERIWKKLIM
jgi:hypothetical protein